MRLVVLTSGFPRRSETFALNELLALDAAGCLEAVFATKAGEPGPAQPGVDRLAPKVHVLAAGSAEEQAEEIVRRLGGARVTGVHGYFAHVPADVAARVARRLGVPHGFSVHALDARRVGAERLAERGREAACVIACNTDVAGDLRRAGAPVQLVPHGVDLERFSPAPEPEGPALSLLAVGRLVEKKGFPVLIDAAARLTVPCRLRIVGQGPERAALERRIAAAGLEDRAQLPGPRTHEELPAEYASAHVVVVPSVLDSSGDRDGLPNVVLEAMASGRAVVACDVGAIAGAVIDGRTGLLVAPGDAGALAAAIESLAGDPALRARLAAGARAHVEREFELHTCTGRLQRHLEAAYA